MPVFSIRVDLLSHSLSASNVYCRQEVMLPDKVMLTEDVVDAALALGRLAIMAALGIEAPSHTHDASDAAGE